MQNCTEHAPLCGLVYESPSQTVIALCPRESLLENSPQSPLEPINPGTGHDW